ncbi:MAG: ATP-binding protein [Pseudomonadales bacterium]|nr:ATP-binding protein [Pseudomonadales bacterium]
MKDSVYRTRQHGNFSVEFAIVGVVFSLLIVFSGDVIMKLSLKGKLDRLSYSGVSILKERNEFYDEDYNVTQADAEQLQVILKQSLQRTLAAFDESLLGVHIEKADFTSAAPRDAYNIGQDCQPATSLNELEHLSVVTSWDRQSALYRVSLCYDSDNWFGALVGENYTRVSSSSVIIGR